MTWLTTSQAADRIHRDVSTVTKAAQAGILHGHQPMRDGRPVHGSRWRFAEAAVDAYVQGGDERAQRQVCGCPALRVVRRAS